MKKIEAGRIAFRHEGEWWNAYWSRDQHSMDNAVKLGSIRINLASGAARDKFIDTMKAAFTNITQETFGATPEWGGERPAPESERRKELGDEP